MPEPCLPWAAYLFTLKQVKAGTAPAGADKFLAALPSSETAETGWLAWDAGRGHVLLAVPVR